MVESNNNFYLFLFFYFTTTTSHTFYNQKFVLVLFISYTEYKTHMLKVEIAVS